MTRPAPQPVPPPQTGTGTAQPLPPNEVDLAELMDEYAEIAAANEAARGRNGQH